MPTLAELYGSPEPAKEKPKTLAEQYGSPAAATPQQRTLADQYGSAPAPNPSAYEEPEGRGILERAADFAGDFAAPFMPTYAGADARRQIKDPELGLPATILEAAESIPVKITNLGTTPVMEAPAPGLTAQLSEGLGGGIGRAALTGPLGPGMLGAGEALAKSAEIATQDPEAFREKPLGTAARIGIAGAIPSASAKIAGVVAPKIAGALQNPAAQFGAGAATAGAVDFGLNTGQKGVEYLGGTEDPTLGGLAGAMKPTAMDLATLAPGAVGGGYAARKALAGALEAPDVRPMPEVEVETPIQPEGQVNQVELPDGEAQGQAGRPGQVAGEQAQPLPTGQERQGDPSSLGAESTRPQGTDDPRYAGGFNKRLFGMEETPELQPVYEAQALRTGNPLESVSREQVRAAADQTPPFTLDRLRKIQKADDARALSPADTQALSDQMAGYANARLSRDLSPDEQGMFDELSRAAKIARGVRGQDLALLNQESIARDVQQGNYKAAAVKALDEISPTGQTSPEAIKAIREMADDPLSMARTVFRESRKNHGFLQNFVTPNLLSNILGTQSVNSFSNFLKLAADTAAERPSEYGTRLAGAAKGAARGKERAAFAFREGFSERALEDPTVAAKAPGFAFGGRKNPFNIPGRAAFASDEFFKGMAERSHLDVLVKARAKELAGGDAAKQAEIEANLIANPPKDLLDESRDFAAKATYQAEPKEGAGWLGEVESALSRMINAGVMKGTRTEVKPIKLLGVPFWTTVLNVAKANVQYSPLSLPGTAYKAAKGKITPGQAVAQTAMGLVPTMAGIALANEGYVTGPMPDDPAEREAFFNAGKKPWSIRVGNTNIPLVWAGPFAMSLGIGAAINDAKRKRDMGKIDDETMSLIGTSAQNTYRLFSESSPLIALNSLMNVFSDPTESKLKKWASDFGSQFVPLVSAQGFVNRQDLPLAGAARDPYMRDTTGESALEEVWNRIVSRTTYSHTLPKRETSLGTDAQRAGVMTGTADPVFAELYRLGVYPGMSSESLPKQPGALRAERMNPEEYRSVLQAGDPIYDLLRQQVATPTWADLPDDQKRLIVDRTLGAKGLGRFREVARKKVQANRLAGAQ